MSSRLTKYLIIIQLILTSAWIKGQEIGRYPIHNFNHREYSGHSQSWSITQDHRGLIYIANNVGVIEYDGMEWRHISINDAHARCLDVDSYGRIWVGAQDELGYLAPDSLGALKYVSLTDLLPPTCKPLGLVRSVYVAREGIYFCTNQSLFLLKDKKVKVWKPKTSFHRTFLVSGIIFTNQPGFGLTYLKNDSLIRVPGGERFANELIYIMLPHTKGRVLIGTQVKGFFDYNLEALKNHSDVKKDSLLIPFKTSNNDYFLDNIIYHGLVLPDNNFAISTYKGGAVIMSQEGVVTRTINRESGLQDDAAWYLFPDNQNNLWIALNNGISYTPINSQLSNWNETSGIRGTLQSVTRFNGNLYITSNIGVFLKEGTRFEIIDGVPNLSNELFVVTTSDKKTSLLVATTTGIFQITGSKGQLIENGPFLSYSFLKSRVFPDIVYVGLNNGVGVIKYSHGSWKLLGQFEETHGPVYSLAEDNDGCLWYSYRFQGICRCNVVNPYQLVLDDHILFSQLPHSPKFDDMSINFIDGVIRVATDKGLCRFNSNLQQFESDSMLGLEFTDGKTGLRFLATDSVGHLWFEAYKYYPNRWIERASKDTEGRYRRIPAQFRTIPDMIFNDVFVEKDDITWIAASDGLYRFDGKVTMGNQSMIKSIIRRVTVQDEKIIYNGAYRSSSDTSDFQRTSYTQSSNYIPTLSYSNNSVVFSFSSPYFGQNQKLQYSHYLEGYDTKWSEWNTDPKKEYTNLNHGKFTFHLKARNIFEEESPVDSFTFVIQRPWYKSNVAYSFYFISLLLIIWSVTVINTRILKKSNLKLQMLIAERTKELIEFQNEIVEKNEELQQQKEVMQLQRDEVQDKNLHINESLQYAKTIQQAILPDLNMLNTNFEYFLIFRPKDVVSGDFYWISRIPSKGKHSERYFIAVVDCTGHGVPGAFMSMIGSRLLNDIVNERKIFSPAKILSEMNTLVNQALRQHISESFDGMDVSLCLIEKRLPDQYAITFSGANRPVYYYQKGIHRIQSMKGNRKCIGSILPDVDPEFINNTINLQAGDMLFLNSDGIIDQNNEYKKKYTSARLHGTILSNINKPMVEIGEGIIKSFDEFTGDVVQRDDITVLGLKFKGV